MLIGRPYGDAVVIGRRNKSVRFDGEVRHHRERIDVFENEGGLGRLDVAMSQVPFLENIGVGKLVAGAQFGFPHQRHLGVQRIVD